MFPNLSYFLYHFTGIGPDGALSNIKTYGFFLVVGIVCGMFIFKSELRRKEKEGIFGQHELSDGNEYKGMFTQVFLNWHMIVVVLMAYLGSKIFSLLDKLPQFFEAPLATLKISGDVAYGGIIGGALTSIVFFKRKKLAMLPILDTFGPTLMLSNGIVRLGCYFGGDGCWGINAAQKPSWWIFPDWAWSSHYRHNIIQEGKIIKGCTFQYNRILETPVHPTSLYEAIICFSMFGLLWFYRKKPIKAGLLFGFFLMLNGTERFFIEFIRVTKKYMICCDIQLSQAQIIAIILFLIGVIWCSVLIKKPMSNF